MDEAMLVTWLVEPGDHVGHGQIIAEVETDKGIIEVECWHDGVVDELYRQPGAERLAVGTPLARIRVDEPEGSPTSKTQMPSSPAEQRPPRVPAQPSPPIRLLARTLGVDIDKVSGTGANGSLTRADVQRASRVAPQVEERSHEKRRVKASPLARARADELGVSLRAVTPSRADGLIVSADVEEADLEDVGVAVTEPESKVAAMRKAIARSMSRSKREIPHYYLATRIDMDPALSWLEDLNSGLPIAKRILPAVLLIKATVRAVREVPDLNGHWVDEGFRLADPVHLGVAISLRGGGLVAPAIHDADTLELGELMEHLRDLVTRARSWRLRGSEMSDPTITVTNLGDRGVHMAFPVIIPPQVAMVGFGKIVEEVVAVDGMPAVHPVVHATLAADHRVTDGHTGGLFLTALDRQLQQPEEL